MRSEDITTPAVGKTPTSTATLAVTLAVLWGVAAAGGLAGMMAYARRPDPAADARPVWPAALSWPKPAGQTLVVCLHPKCPCSDATVDAVQTLLAGSPALSAVAVFGVPAGEPGWDDGELVARCRGIKGLRVVIDPDGRDCGRLGAKSSGQAFLYDARGRLSFAGGLTSGRGERGASAGAAAVAGLLAGRGPGPDVVSTTVFGCALVRRAKVEAVQ